MPLNSWTDYLQKHLFKKQDEFFELPYLSKNPQLMTESVIHMPVFSHSKDEQAIYTDNPFTKGIMRYRELDRGLWLLIRAAGKAKHYHPKLSMVVTK